MFGFNSQKKRMLLAIIAKCRITNLSSIGYGGTGSFSLFWVKLGIPGNMRVGPFVVMQNKFAFPVPAPIPAPSWS